MTKLMLIATGGALGALARYGLAGLTYRLLGEGFPWGTLVVNVGGCLAIGFTWAFVERAPAPTLAPLLLTGFLGAFTTFSTFSLETLHLFRVGAVGPGLANIVASNGLGLLAVGLGFLLARLLMGPLPPVAGP